MNYQEWFSTQQKKKKKILQKIAHLNNEEKIAYFEFDNMSKYESNFCPLYQQNKKCHDLESLNCLFCDCPYFSFDDAAQIQKSHCTIHSIQGKIVEYNNIKHQDCSKCPIPHSKDFARKFLKQICS